MKVATDSALQCSALVGRKFQLEIGSRKFLSLNFELSPRETEIFGKISAALPFKQTQFLPRD